MDNQPDRTAVAPQLNRALHVLHVIPGSGEGSSMVFCRQQIEALERHGVIVTKFFLQSRTHPFRLIRAVGELRQLAAAVRPDIVHAQYGTMTAFLSLFCGLPLVVTFRGSDLNPDPAVSAARSLSQKAMSHFAAWRARGIICVSEQLKNRLFYARDKVEVIPSGFDETIFKPMERDSARSELGWHPEERIVLFNATGQSKVKRIDLAKAAIDIAKKKIGPLRLVTMQGGYTPDEVCMLMNASDCLLLTSQWEGSPTVVQEALACNLPVVSVDVGDVAEHLSGIEPSRVTSSDRNALAEGLVAILASPRRSNGETSARGLSHDALTERLIGVYRKALSL